MAGFFSKIINAFKRDQVDWDELEADLVTSDIGIPLTLSLIKQLQDEGIKDPDIAVSTIKEKIQQILPPDSTNLTPLKSGNPSVIMMVGVNGTGKTTSSAKLAYLLRQQGHSVLLVAADTFRAAAVEQLEFWATKLQLPLYKGSPNQDPASVCYEAHSKALKEGIEFVICDTAGRLHTRNNLMQELAKIRRTLAKQDETAPHYTFLVVDATTGANALNQAKEFQKATPLDGVIVTKLDGSGKGGIVVSLMDTLQITPYFIGTGESEKNFSPFDKKHFVDQLL